MLDAVANNDLFDDPIKKLRDIIHYVSLFSIIIWDNTNMLYYIDS